MINVTVMNNVKREKAIVSENTTIREILERFDIDYSRGTIHMDGSPLEAGELDMTFADFGIDDHCYLTNVLKADNA